jgi:hypothetical protein
MMASRRLPAAVMPALNGTLQKAHLIKPQPRKLGLGIIDNYDSFYVNPYTDRQTFLFFSGLAEM